MRSRLLQVLASAAAIAAGPAVAAPSSDPYAAPVSLPIGAASAPHSAKDYGALAGLPDWSGIWVLDFGPASPPPGLTPAYAAKVEAARKAQANGQDSPRPSNCLPPGMPMIMGQPYNVEFLFTPGRVTLIQEAYMQVRRIFTDGRRHPGDLEASFNGHSIGHWQDGALVVDSTGFKPVTMLDQTTPHSDRLHIVEHIHLTGPDTLADEMTIDDDDALARPWAVTFTYTRHREWDQIEFICEENNRNPVDETGKTHFILRDNPNAQ